LDFSEARDDWVDDMQIICSSLQTNNLANNFTGRMLFLTPNRQSTGPEKY